MAVEWLVCEDCDSAHRRGPISLSAGPGAAEAPPNEAFGEHKREDKRCPGSDKRPMTSYWGDSFGRFFRWQNNPRKLPDRPGPDPSWD